MIDIPMLDLKAIPIKVGEPKRLVSLLAGGAFIVAGQMVKQNFLSWMLYGAGLTMLGMTIAGIVNPVTIYGGSRDVGQGFDNSARVVGTDGAAANFDVAGKSAGVWQPGATQGADGVWVPAQGPGNIPTQQYGVATVNLGKVTGQADPAPGQAPGTYYGAGLGNINVPNPPDLYGATVGGPAWARDVYSSGGINIRSFGATQFLGG